MANTARQRQNAADHSRNTRSQSKLDSAQKNRIRQALLRELPLLDRLLVVLRFHERMTVAEIASIMRMTVDEVADAERRIISLLKQQAQAA